MRMTLRQGIGSMVAIAGIGAAVAAVAFPGRARATSKEGSTPSASYAVILDAEAEANQARPAVESPASPARPDSSGDAAAALFTLFGFLGLISGNLVRWSRSTSSKSNPSVF